MGTLLAFAATVLFVIAALAAWAVISVNVAGFTAVGLAALAGIFWVPKVVAFLKKAD